jgi:hypothetical protein
MLGHDDDARRTESKVPRTGQGWSSLHSWIFLGVVAVGLLVIGWQNRYFYLSPLGLGKAYRIDKLFGGIQEFEPGKGWIVANIQPMPLPSSQPPPMSMMEPPGSMPGSSSPASRMAGMLPPPSVDLSQVKPSGPPMPSPDKSEPTSPRATSPVSEEPQVSPASTPKEMPKELGEEEKFQVFKKVFPEFGKDEFQLANDDLYPDWKKTVSPTGTWNDFLPLYGDFVQWWTDKGSPPEPGFKLWRDFLATRPKN